MKWSIGWSGIVSLKVGVMWTSKGRVFQAEESACAKALRQKHTELAFLANLLQESFMHYFVSIPFNHSASPGIYNSPFPAEEINDQRGYEAYPWSLSRSVASQAGI